MATPLAEDASGPGRVPHADGGLPDFGPRPPSRLREFVLRSELFKDAVVRERKRTDRTGEPFAVLLVDTGDDNTPGGAPWDQILQALGAVKRQTDVVGWLEEHAVVGLLVPEVGGEHGALKVLHRLQREIAKRTNDCVEAALSIRLYAHPVSPGPGEPAIPSVDLLLEGFETPHRQRVADVAKRTLDIVASLGLLALFLPALVAIFVAVKWTSPGPAFFRQVRIGRKGVPFTMLKFRSMRTGAGHGIHQEYVTWFIKSSGQQPRTGDEVFKLTRDPRITAVGHFIRKTSLDELPQFFNVLRGEMSLVGPRPPLPFEVEQYQPWHRRRVLDAKPGLTGLWQVTGRSRTTFDEMVRLDLRYARTRSFWGDIRILAATPRAMVSGKGAL